MIPARWIAWVRRLGVALVVIGLVLPELAVAVRARLAEPSAGGGAVAAPPPRLRPEMIVLPPGGAKEATFTMGSPKEEVGRDDDETLHRVTVSQFEISRTEVTQAQFAAVTRRKPFETEKTSDSRGVACREAGIGDDLPATCVSWFEAVDYCNRLSVLQGLTAAYHVAGETVSVVPNADGYRLPTEAEWEYAARAGGSAAYGWISDPKDVCTYANVADEAAKRANPDWTTFDCPDGFSGLAPVALRAANPWQLYDTIGNVWEWVWDGYGGDYVAGNEPIRNPRGFAGGATRVLRGGSFVDVPQYARVANRPRDEPSSRGDYLGFRLARSLPSFD